jgi:hypothetical protein
MKLILLILLLVALKQCDCRRSSELKLDNAILHGRLENDAFDQLSLFERATEWSQWSESLSWRQSDIDRWEYPSYVEVRLVGLGRHAHFSTRAQRRNFERYFDRVLRHEPLSSLVGLHACNISAHLHFTLSWADESLARDLEKVRDDALRQLGDDAERSDEIGFTGRIPSHEGGWLALIDGAAVQRRLETDAGLRGSDAAVLYVLALLDADETYAYGDAADDMSCPTTMYAAATPSSPRVAWVDLAAGPLRYGPRNGGAGTVTHTIMPYLSMQPTMKTASHAVEDDDDDDDETVQRRDFMAQVVAYVERSAQRLLVPPMMFAPSERRALARSVVFDVVSVLQDAPGVAQQHQQFSTAEVLRAINSLPPVLGHTVRIKSQQLRLGDNNFLSLAYVSALRTSLGHRRGGAAAGSSDTLVLDSRIFHSVLQRYLRYRQLTKGELRERAADRSEMLVTVFVFHLHAAAHSSASAPLLFDGVHQAMAFDDMVIAVETSDGERRSASGTRAAFAPSAVQCESRVPFFVAGDATRALVGAMLSTGFNVAPTHRFYDVDHARVDDDYLWAPSPSVFGPMNADIAVPWHVADAAARNVVFERVVSVQRRVRAIVAPLRAHPLGALLGQADLDSFAQRWNMLAFKLERVAQHVAMHHYSNAIRYIIVIEHDLAAIERLAATAKRNIQIGFVCSSGGAGQEGASEQSVPMRGEHVKHSVDLELISFLVLGPCLSLFLFYKFATV